MPAPTRGPRSTRAQRPTLGSGQASRDRRRSSPVLELMPARRRQQLEQGAAAVRVVVLEVGVALVELDFQLALLHTLVEPGASEDELLQPVDERFALHEGNLGPVANEVAAELAAGLLDSVPLDELDQVGRLVVVQLVALE